MATKGVLLEAIRKLEILNEGLRVKLGTTAKGKERDDILGKITRNNTMILDFKYRLENE
jgi:hypothetical protein